MANEKYACLDKDDNIVNVIVLDVEKENEMKPLLKRDLGYRDIVRYDDRPNGEHAAIGGKYDKQNDKFVKPPEPKQSIIPAALRVVRKMKEAKSGVFYVEKDVVSDRDWKIRLNSDKATIMSDAEAILKPYYRLEDEAVGNVLLCGLGLGFAPVLCSMQEAVTHVDVVELQQDIITLVAEHIANPKINVIQGDINQYLVNTNEVYDVAHFDHFLEDLGPTPEEAATLTALVKAKSPNCKVLFWQS